jgi:hypothetical protein
MVLGGGSANYGPKKEIQPGEIVYFPEGTPYGPQEGTSDRYGLTLQFGGPSGFGYSSRKRMYEARDLLKQFGTFEKGVYRRSGELAEGQRRNQDSYEAIWEYVNGRKMTYPAPRYEEPIHMRPANFKAHLLPDQPGVAIKRLGVFSEREVSVAMFNIDGLDGRAQLKISPRSSRQLGCIVNGAGTLDGQELRQYTVFELLRDEGATLAASTATELVLIGLPIFSAEEIRQFQDECKARRSAISSAA